MEPKSTLIKGLFGLVGVLPLSALRVLGFLLGRGMWWANGRAARVTQRNIDMCFPDLAAEERGRLARESLVHTGQCGLELIKVWMQPNARSIASIVGVRNQPLFDQALVSGRGLLLLVPHLGNWEVVALWCAQHREFTALYQPPKQALLEPIIKNARERMGNKLYPTDVSGVRAVLRALKKSGFSGILPDQEPDPDSGEFATFFRNPALTMTLVHGLASRTDCDVLMAYGHRVPGGWEIVFRPTIGNISSAELQESLWSLNRSVESCIMDCPEQYQWEYKRFKKRPDGLPKVYQF